jgi:oligopeptide/dipeptide ABC transporter ATP-binding protein
VRTVEHISAGCRRSEGKSLLLQVEGLSVRFPSEAGLVHAVDDVSFSVGQGEVIGVVGESGSGKSVMASAVIGLVPPPGRVVAGRLSWRGEELPRSEPELHRLRGRAFSMVFQNPLTSLNPSLTIGQLLREAMRAHRSVSRAEAKELSIAALAEVELTDPEARLRQYPHELSGGMRQRVALAMALINRPDLLIADEATSSLDVTIQAQLIDLLSRLAAERGMSLLFISHDLGTVARFCDRVIVLYAGQVVESGPTGQVLRQPFHPYTRGLLNSIPPAHRVDRLPAVRGAPLRNVDPGPGCRFMPRCPSAELACERPQELWEAAEKRVALCAVAAAHGGLPPAAGGGTP